MAAATMAAGGVRFALNHACVPGLGIGAFFDLARELGMGAVEIRNDIDGTAILDGTPADVVGGAARDRGLRIASINALQRFNEWNDTRAGEAAGLIAYAAGCGAEALVLVPTNDGAGCADGERQANLRTALTRLRPMLQEAGLVGLVEALGFDTSSLRLKSEAVAAIRSVGADNPFRIVHDTFHHQVAGEPDIFPGHTGMVHISGVADRDIGVAEMSDPLRVLVDGQDRLDNIGQIKALRDGGYAGPFSFEPFAPEVQASKSPGEAIGRSIEYIGSSVQQWRGPPCDRPDNDPRSQRCGDGIQWGQQ